MVDNVKVPILGSQPKKHLYIIGGVAVAVVGVAYYRSKKASTATAAAVPATQIDPSTGFAYGSAEDAAALAQQASYVSAGGAGATDDNAGGGGSISSTPNTITDNSSWSEAAQQYLVGVVGLDGPTVSAALGGYISAAALTDAQVSIIQQAIAAVGYPPQSGTSGYPPAFKTTTTAPTGGNTVTPITTYANGFYLDPDNGTVYEVSNNVRYRLDPVEWANLKAKGATYITTSPNWAGMGLPLGTGQPPGTSDVPAPVPVKK